MSSSKQESQRVKTALAVIQGFRDWDIAKIMEPRSSTCTYQLLPKSLERPVMDNQAYQEHFSSLMPYFRNYNLTIQDIVEDEKANKVVVWTHSTADTRIGPYENEHILHLSFNEAGDKVDKFLEFVDSDLSKDFAIHLHDDIAQARKEDEEATEAK